MSIEFVLAVLFSLIIVLIYLKVLKANSKIIKLIIFVLGTIFLTIIWGAVTGYVWFMVYQFGELQKAEFANSFLFTLYSIKTYLGNISTFGWIINTIQQGIFFIISLTVIFFLTWYREQYYFNRKKAEEVKVREKEVLLKMLRYQINPHFLFNTLNSLHALIDEDSEKAKKLVGNIFDYYKLTLNKVDQKVSIENEIETVKQYLQILKIRFEEKFEYEIECDEKAKEINIPSFIIYLLVENAVKFGIKTSKDKLSILLNVALQNSRLFIELINSGNLIDSNELQFEKEGTGTGIENIKSRLKLFYGDGAEFSIKEVGNNVKAVIIIPEDWLNES